MNEVLVIEGKQVERIEYNGQPVLTMPMVDEIHQRPEGTARRNFNQNRGKFIVGEDFYELPYEEWSVLVGRISSDQRGKSSDQRESKGGHRGNMIILGLSGYLMLAKSFTDDLSWHVQRILVKSYFRVKQMEIQTKYVELLEDFHMLAKKKLIERRRLTPDEILRIKELAAGGLGLEEIGRIVGRNRSTIHYVLRDGISEYRPRSDN